MQERYFAQPRVLGRAQENTLLRSVYNWMVLGLFVSGGIAYLTAHSAGLQQIIFGNSFMIWVLFLGELGLVFGISGGIHRMSAATASWLFLLFSFINGLTLSSIFLVYTSASLATTFFITGFTFGLTSLYGYATQTNLSSIGNYLFMGLIGIIVATTVNIFLRNSMLDLVISYIGILIFVGLTAYDTQKIRRMGENMAGADSESLGKMAILGALALYLDFVNLFLMLLRIFGRSDR